MFSRLGVNLLPLPNVCRAGVFQGDSSRYSGTLPVLHIPSQLRSICKFSILCVVLLTLSHFIAMGGTTLCTPLFVSDFYLNFLLG